MPGFLLPLFHHLAFKIKNTISHNAGASNQLTTKSGLKFQLITSENNFSQVLKIHWETKKDVKKMEI